MTSEQPATMPGAVKAMLWILAVILLFALSSSFNHMIHWTSRATAQPNLFGFANAVISELVPTFSFLSINVRLKSGRSIAYPVTIFLASIALSIAAQLSAAGTVFPGERQFLFCLPALAVAALVPLGHAEIEHVKQVRSESEQAAERARVAAERAAERARTERAERERVAVQAAQERAAEQARAEALAEQSRAEQLRAEADRAAAQAQLAAERAAEEKRRHDRELLAERQSDLARRVSGGAARAEQPKRAAPPGPRRSSEVTRALIDAAIADLPAGTGRAEAVKVAAQKLGMTEKGVRNHIPADFCARGPEQERRLRLA